MLRRCALLPRSDGMSDLYEILNNLHPSDPSDAVDARIGYLNPGDPVAMDDHILNIEKARAGVPLSHVVTDASEFWNITGHYPDTFIHDFAKSVAENDWDGDGISNRDEVLIFHTDPRNATNRPSDAELGTAYLAGRTSLTTNLNFATLFSGIDSDGDGLPDWVQVKYGLAPGSASTIRSIDGQTDGLTWKGK
jgi:hypothetical protein